MRRHDHRLVNQTTRMTMTKFTDIRDCLFAMTKTNLALVEQCTRSVFGNKQEDFGHNLRYKLDICTIEEYFRHLYF